MRKNEGEKVAEISTELLKAFSLYKNDYEIKPFSAALEQAQEAYKAIVAQLFEEAMKMELVRKLTDSDKPIDGNSSLTNQSAQLELEIIELAKEMISISTKISDISERKDKYMELCNVMASKVGMFVA